MTVPALRRSAPVRDATRAPRERVRRPQRLERIALRLVVPVAILALWWLLSVLPATELFVANPVDAFARVWTDFFSADPATLFLGESAIEHALPGVGRALAGLLIATVAGIAVGIVLGSSVVLTALFQPIIHIGRSLPTPALLGVFFLLFGVGDLPAILLIAFGVVWPILFNTIHGVASIGLLQKQVVTVYKIAPTDILFRVILPGAAPKIFAGVRTALSLSLIIMVISELQKSQNGLGYLLALHQRAFDYTGFWAVLIVLAVLGVIFNLVFQFIESRVLAWHRGATKHDDHTN